MNEKVGRSHKYNIASVKCLIICILSLLFAVFLYMKINGFFDYTSNNRQERNNDHWPYYVQIPTDNRRSL